MEELVKVFVMLVHKGMSRRIVMRFCGVLAGSVKEYRNLHREFNLALSKQKAGSDQIEPSVTDDPAPQYETAKRGRKKKDVTNQAGGQHDNA